MAREGKSKCATTAQLSRRRADVNQTGVVRPASGLHEAKT